MSVNLSIQEHIAIITIDNPPVNALSQSVRQGLIETIATINQDTSIKGTVLHGSERIFSAGADITEFGKPPMEPSLPNVIDVLESCRVPIVAALSGVALGGGLEVALGCRYRVGTVKAKTGLPEVNLGLLPGAGGTQRLPRLIGAVKAGEMITTGKPLDADKALQVGILDAMFETNLIGNALVFLENKLDANDNRPALCDVTELPKPDPDGFRALTKKTKAKARGQLSPIKALEAVAAAELPFRKGMAKERALFMDCMASDQRAGLIHSFFAERQVGKIPGLEDTKTRDVKIVTILGAGTMGAGIAIAFLNGGYTVNLFDINADALKAGEALIIKTLESSASKGRITPVQMQQHLGKFSTISNMEGAGTSDLIIEAATENIAIKKSIFRDLDAIAKPGCILASNTSYLDINILAAETKRPADVIGMHFFSPAHIMKLLEVVRTDSVSDTVINTVMKVGKSIGKISVLSGVCDGFIGNRILKAYRKQADYMVEDGAMPQDVDRVMRAFGFAMGPFEVSDLAGLDIGWHNRRREDAARPDQERYSDLADKLYDLGRYGQKTGSGWYQYEKGSRTPIIDPFITGMIVENAVEKNIARRDFSDDEIRKRILFAMINEGAKILDEGIALRSLDIDMVYVNGYGFPAYRGGPMFYADEIGAKNILEGINKFAKQDPTSWKASALLEKLAITGGKFSDC
ncbi:MAG: 3-hydroxyacyl-CoA dehydrogenase NAD-binding domain-containing protein [Robiginitomaculum sp.]